MSYKFVSSFQPEPESKQYTQSFIQIADFTNPKTNLYHVKKFIINQHAQIINCKDYYITKKNQTNLIEKRKVHEYKIYPVYDLNTVLPPSPADISVLRSGLLSGNSNYYNFASF
jgi:hypothetical protein